MTFIEKVETGLEMLNSEKSPKADDILLEILRWRRAINKATTYANYGSASLIPRMSL